VQRENGPLRDYIEMFNRAAVELRTDDQMKFYLLDRRLRLGRDFTKAFGIEEIRTMDAFLEKAQKYIQCEDKQMVVDVKKSKHLKETGPSHQRNSYGDNSSGSHAETENSLST
jgi:hypothetical protein